MNVNSLEYQYIYKYMHAYLYTCINIHHRTSSSRKTNVLEAKYWYLLQLKHLISLLLVCSSHPPAKDPRHTFHI